MFRDNSPHETLSRDECRVVTAVLRHELETDPAILFAYLFGSFLETGTFRDVDVGIYLADRVPGQSQADALDLEERLSRIAGLPVQVTVLNPLPAGFLYHVFKGELLFCREGEEEMLADLLEDTTTRYLDYEPMLRRSTREAFVR